MSTPRRIAVPATRSSATVLKARRRIVIVVLALLLLVCLIGTVSNLTRPDPVIPPQVGVDTRLAAVAEQAGRDFLAGRNSVVPAAAGVDTNFSGAETPLPDPEKGLTPEDRNAILHGVSGVTIGSFALQGSRSYRLGDNDQQTVHLIRFRATVNSAPFILTVPVVDDPTYGAVLGATPSLTSTAAGAKDTAGTNYEDTYQQAAEVTPEAEASIAKWVAAFTTQGRDSDILRTVTADQDPNRTYSGLGLSAPGELLEVISAIPSPVGIGPPGLIAQIRVALPFNAATGFTLSSTYDLYVVTEGSPAQPPVVAWGPAGSAEDLEPYMNAN